MKIYSQLLLLCAVSCCTQPEPDYPPWPLIWPVHNRPSPRVLSPSLVQDDHAFWTLELTRARKRVLAIERLRTSDIEFEKWNALMWIAQHDEIYCQVKLLNFTNVVKP